MQKPPREAPTGIAMIARPERQQRSPERMMAALRPMPSERRPIITIPRNPPMPEADMTRPIPSMLILWTLARNNAEKPL